MQQIQAVAYARYSSDKQQESSIVVQIGEIRRFCKAHNIALIHEYIDEAQSGTNSNRHSFQEMVKEAPFGNFQYVIVHRMDRWARNVDDARYYKKYLAKYGVKIVSTIENFEPTPEGEFFELMSMGMAELYSKKLARESVAGRIANAKECKAHGGTPALGYKVVSKKYVINSPEAEAVKIIFEMYRDGFSYIEIRNYLNENGYRRSNGKKYSSHFHDILRNRKYIGEYVFNRSAPKDIYGKRNNHLNKAEAEIIRIPNGMPRIIDDKLFSDVQKILDSRQYKHYTPLIKNRHYLLSGIVRCGSCGSAITGDISYTHNNKFKHPIYRCNNSEIKCSTKYIRAEYLDDYIIKLLRKCILNQTNKNLLYNLIKIKFDDVYKSMKKHVKDNDKKVDELRQNIVDEKDIVSSGNESSIKMFSVDRIEELNNQIKEVELDTKFTLEDLANFPELDVQTIQKNVIRYKNNLLSNEFLDKRQTLIALIDTIIIDNEHIKITLKLNKFLDSHMPINATIIVDRDLVAINKNHEGQSFAFTKLKIV